MKREKTPMKISTKIRILKVLGVFISLAPLITAVAINFKTYFYHSSGIQVGFGGMLAIILLLAMSKDSVKHLKGVWGYLIVFLLAVLLRPVLDDIILLTGMALAGKAGECICITPFASRLKAKQGNIAVVDNIESSFVKMFKEQVKSLGGNHE